MMKFKRINSNEHTTVIKNLVVITLFYWKKRKSDSKFLFIFNNT